MFPKGIVPIILSLCISDVNACLPMNQMDMTTVSAGGGQRTTMGSGSVPPSTEPGEGTTIPAPPGGMTSMPGGVITVSGGGTAAPGISPSSVPGIPGTPAPGTPGEPGVPGTQGTSPPGIPGSPAPNPPGIPGTPGQATVSPPGFTPMPGLPTPPITNLPGQPTPIPTSASEPGIITMPPGTPPTFIPGQPGTTATQFPPSGMPTSPGVPSCPGAPLTPGVPLTLPPGMPTASGANTISQITPSIPGAPSIMTTSGGGAISMMTNTGGEATLSALSTFSTGALITTTTTCVTAPSTESCGDGYQYTSATNYCYRLLSGPATWAQFRGFCTQAGGDLISIHSEEENNFAISLVQAAGLTSGVYIGLMSVPGMVNTYTRWSDGTPIDFTRWGHGNPSGNGDPNTCIHFWRNEGVMRWDDMRCRAGAAAICKRIPRFLVAGQCLPEMQQTTPIPPETTTQACQTGGGMACAPGWALLGQFCYAVLGGTATWDVLQDTCNDYNAQMVSIHSEVERDFVRQLTSAAGINTYYIGLQSAANNSAGTAYDVWSDGTLIDYSNFNYDARILGRTGNNLCIEDSNGNGRTWRDTLCNTLLAGTVCKRPGMCSNLMPPITAETSGGVTATGSTITATPMSSATGSMITEAPMSPATVSMITAAPISTGTITAVTMTTTVSPTTTTTTCNLATEDTVCGPNYNYSTATGMCYSVFRQSLNFAASRQLCRSQGGDLASVHSDAENEFIFQLGLSQGQGSSSYLGLMSRPGDPYGYGAWSDGTPLDFSRWDRGQPHGYIPGGPNCIIFTGANARWDDVHCRGGLGGYCKRAPLVTVGGCISTMTTLPMPPPEATTPPPPTTPPCAAENACPAMWDLYIDNCYRAVNMTDSTWDDFNATCANMNSMLVTVHSTGELNFINGLSRRDIRTNFYIGMRTASNETGRQSVYDEYADGSVINAGLWPDPPVALANGTRCVFSTGARFMDTLCDSTDVMWAMCEMPAECRAPTTSTTTTSTTTTTTTTCNVATEDTVCGPNYNYSTATGMCYSVFRQSLNFDASRALCRSQGGDLASVHSDEENEFIFQLGLSQGQGSSSYLGLMSRPGDPYGYGAWSDGTPLDFSRWDRGQPHGYIPGGPNCIIFTGANARWDDVHCRGGLGGYCKRAPLVTVGGCIPTMTTLPMPPPEATTPPPPTTPPCAAENACPAMWDLYIDNCYRAVNMTDSTWDDFNATCANMNSMLVTVHSTGELNFINGLSRRDIRTNFYIGMRTASNETGRQSVYDEYADGSVINAGLWPDPPVALANGTRCAFSTGARFMDTLCDSTDVMWAMCEMPAECGAPTTSTTTTSTTTTTTTTCNVATEDTVCGPNYNYSSATGMCYSVFRQSLNFDASRALCRSQGGDLASVHSDAENEFIFQLGLSQGQGSSSYLGLMSRPGDPYGYGEWSDGTPLDFSRWDRGQPHGYIPGGPNCIIFTGANARWDDVHCRGGAGGYCKRAPLVTVGGCIPTMTTLPMPPPETTAGPATTTPPCADNACPAMWDRYTNNCYRAINMSDSTWENFNTSCSAMSSTMVTVHSTGELNFINELARRDIRTNFYIGMRTADNETGRQSVYDEYADGSVINAGLWPDPPVALANGTRCAF